MPNWPAHVTGGRNVVAAMDKVGVDGAIFISTFCHVPVRRQLAVEVQRAHPGSFAIVKPVDRDEPVPQDR